jgi:hypothetical protein
LPLNGGQGESNLPQGFTYSPNLFGYLLEQVLEEFALLSLMSLLQYVDDLLLSGLTEKKVMDITINPKLLGPLRIKRLKN